MQRLVAFYVEAHNDVMPHSAFDGQTPNEVFFETGGAVVANLAAKRVQAQTERTAWNRSAGCGVCIGRAGWLMLLLQRPDSRMPWNGARNATQPDAASKARFR